MIDETIKQNSHQITNCNNRWMKYLGESEGKHYYQGKISGHYYCSTNKLSTRNNTIEE
jgi:hypothetical protein